jgi:hypothetical protein
VALPLRVEVRLLEVLRSWAGRFNKKEDRQRYAASYRCFAILWKASPLSGQAAN